MVFYLLFNPFVQDSGNNLAGGEYSFVGGGGSETAEDANEAWADYSAILGGLKNQTSDTFVPGSGMHSTVSGGSGNKARGKYASVTGGISNDAAGEGSSVSGGFFSTASGLSSSISGGGSRSVTGNYDWRAGGSFEDI